MKIIYISEKDKPKFNTRHFIYKLACTLLSIAFTLTVFCVTTKELVSTAFKQRGYIAIGGEWLLILGCTLATWIGVCGLINRKVGN